MKSIDEITSRINDALAREEIQAEFIANRVRLILLSIMMTLALFNMSSLSTVANAMNIGIIIAGYMYGLAVYVRISGGGPVFRIKYITSFGDIFLVMLLLFLYTLIEIPAVALKNYVFLVVFPLILLTVFRLDQKLTLYTGLWAVSLYLALFFYLYIRRAITIQSHGYMSELFSPEITSIGQSTKIAILISFVALATYLAKYSRGVILKTIQREVESGLEKDSMVRELEIASHVQQQLLPRTTPSIRGLEFHGTVIQGKFVGGDYFDFLKISESRLISIIADVSGKGVPAALIMAEVRSATHLLATMNLSLEEFALRLNRLVLESTAARDYVTCFIAEIDGTERTIRYINAGHPPPYVCDNGSLQALSSRTLALGLREDLPHLREHCIPFPPGNIFVAYTDGILERGGPNEQQFGEDRISDFILSNRLIDLHGLTEKLLREVRSYGDNVPFEDDATVVAVRSALSIR